MGTWVGLLVETQGRADLWEIAARFDIVPAQTTLAAHVLVDGADYRHVMAQAKDLSEALQSSVLGFVVQTTSDVHQLHAFREGEVVRQLDYDRDEGGWVTAVGKPQDWERAYFFGASGEPTHGNRPLLDDDASSEDIGRYEAAQAAGDASPILDLMHPSSTEPMLRLCAFFKLDPAAPAARVRRGLDRWGHPAQKRSLWSRLTWWRSP
jgi:hypothetical protein